LKPVWPVRNTRRARQKSAIVCVMRYPAFLSQ
jgi:hypothetical protein